MAPPPRVPYELRDRGTRKRKRTDKQLVETNRSSSEMTEPHTPNVSSSLSAWRPFAGMPVTPRSSSVYSNADRDVVVKLEDDHAVNPTATPNHYRLTAPAPEIPDQPVRTPTTTAREFAAKWQYEYAGLLTGFLEDRYRQWKGTRKANKVVHDTLCLVCYSDTSADTLHYCATCSRVYHKPCINMSPTRDIPTTWTCPLCQKRLWDALPPPTQKRQGPPSTFELERRRMALAMRFSRNPRFAEWIEFHDDGNVESDHVLIMAMGTANVERYLDLDGGEERQRYRQISNDEAMQGGNISQEAEAEVDERSADDWRRIREALEPRRVDQIDDEDDEPLMNVWMRPRGLGTRAQQGGQRRKDAGFEWTAMQGNGLND